MQYGAYSLWGMIRRFRSFSEFFGLRSGPLPAPRAKFSSVLQRFGMERAMKNEAMQPRNAHAPTAKIISGGDSYVAEQGSVYRSGVAAESAGSTMLWFGMISLPAGRRTSGHRHEGHETALLMTAGQGIGNWS